MSLADYNYIGIALIFFTGLLGFVISRYFENIILRIIAVLFGLALMSDGLKFEDIFSLAFGSGMVLAHVKYFVMYIIGVIKSIAYADPIRTPSRFSFGHLAGSYSDS